MKHILVLIFFFFSFRLFAANDISKLNEIVQTYASLYLDDSAALPEKYILTLEEYKKIAPLRYDSLTIQRNYIHYTSKIQRMYETVKKSSQNFIQVVSYDTITYTEKNTLMLDICIVFTVKNSNIENQKTQRVFSTFAVFDNTLKLAPQIKIMSDEDYYHYELGTLYKTRQKYCDATYSQTIFNDTAFHVIPVKKGKLWGLQDYEGKIIVTPQYDSIYPFKDNYALVVKNNTYNLLDIKYTEYFKEWKKHIYYQKKWSGLKELGIYYVKNNNDTYFKLGEEFGKNSEIAGMDVVCDGCTTEDKENNTTKSVDRFSTYYTSKKYSMEEIYSENKKIYLLKNSASNKSDIKFEGYTYIDKFGDFFYGEKNDTTVVIDSLGKIIFKTTYNIKTEYPGYMLIFNRSARLFGVYCPYTKTYILPEYYYILPIFRDTYFVALTKQYMFGYLDKKGIELFE